MREVSHDGDLSVLRVDTDYFGGATGGAVFGWTCLSDLCRERGRSAFAILENHEVRYGTTETPGNEWELTVALLRDEKQDVAAKFPDRVQPGHAVRVWPILASDAQLTVPGLIGTVHDSELWDVFSSIHFHYRQPGEVIAPPSQKELEARFDKEAARLGATLDESGRVYALGTAAKAAVDAGHLDWAETWTAELVEMMPRHRSEPSYGDAQQDSHSVLGRLALRRGDTESAKAHLLKSGMTEGSATLGSFGPNMKLAQELLEKGEREVVLQYFELCRAFWKMGGDKLDTWTADVEVGRMPQFGANLVY